MMRFTVFETMDTSLEGIKRHFETLTGNPWKVVLRVESAHRLTLRYEDLNVTRLVQEIGVAYGVCGQVHRPLKTITFSPVEDCHQPPVEP